ncbi:lipopolysaccharide biosynthesis protein [Halomonas sp.]|uniref:lipopolysaccharide biosynthesis protein n=1 Tax=Halomonas sp. TaxID=1486246 RepID=UPI00298DFE74|nr:oligosaccharide flippase family protein [Halomonas sp.]MDW7747884.1 oligosaccharide flippase family protein [Halomonas sp.]
MINAAKCLTSSKFVRNVAIVATGTAGAQAITMAFAPIITRLYGPEAFGVFGIYTAILAVLTPLSALSYPTAIVLPKRDADAMKLVRLSIGVALGMTLLAALILLLFKDSIVSAFNLHAVDSFILLLPLAMLFSAAMGVMNQWIIRKKQFKIKAKVAVLQALWINLAKAGIGFFTPIAAVLVFIATAGSALHALMLWANIRKNPEAGMSKSDVDSIEDEASITSLAWRHRDFAYYRTPQVVLNAASKSLPVLMLASFFGPAPAGFYALGKLVLGIPTTLIGQSVAAVFYPRINEAVLNGESPYKLLIKATAALAVVGVLPFATVIAFGPWLFSFVFGQEWYTAGVYAQWLALWSYFGFINRPSVGAIPVLSLQGFFLAYEIMSIGIRAGSLFLGFLMFESALIAVALFSLSSAGLNLFLIIATFVAAKRYKD